MGTYTRFLYEFLAQFFAGLITIVSGIGKGIGQLFNIPGYAKIIENKIKKYNLNDLYLVKTKTIRHALSNLYITLK